MSLDNKIREAFMRHENDVRPRPGSWTVVARDIGPHRRRRAIASGLVVAVVIAGAVLVVPRLGGEPAVIESAERPQPVAKIDLSVYRLYAGRDMVWGLNVPANVRRVRGFLYRIDPRSNTATLRVVVGENANALVDDGHSVWVTHNDGCTTGKICLRYETSPIPRNSVARFDRKTGRLIAAIPVYHPQAITAAWGSIWITTSGGGKDPIGTRLIRIDAATNKVTASIQLGETERYAPIGISNRLVWVLTPTKDGNVNLNSVDPLSNGGGGVGSLPLNGDALMATASNGFWVAGTKAEGKVLSVKRLNRSGIPVARILIPERPSVEIAGLVKDKAFVWVTTTNGHLWKIDPKLNKPVGGPITVGEMAGLPVPAVSSTTDASDRPSLWVAAGDGKVWRFAP